MSEQDRAQQLSQAVEAQVRHALGDLQMQVIVLRQMLELAQGGAPARPGEPRQVPGEQKPNPNPAQPPGVGPGINPDQNPPGSPFPPRNPADKESPQDRPYPNNASALNGGPRPRGA